MSKPQPMDLVGKRITVSVQFDTVAIEIHCGDEYAAQVVYDDITETLKADGGVKLTFSGTVSRETSS